MKKSIFLIFAAILCAMSVDAKVVYLKLNDKWSASDARYYVHVWGGSSSNTSIEMQAVEGETNMYKIEVGTHNSIIFLRHKTTTTVTESNKWNNLLNRLGNLSIPEDENCCTINNGVTTVQDENTDIAANSVTWSTYTPAEPEPEPEPVETHDITVKAKYPATWTAGKAAIHFWGTGVASPGTPAAMTKDGDWWTYTVTGVPTTSPLSVVFINGDNWNGDANQTVNITGITESTCYQVTAGSGKATAAKADCETGEAEVVETHDITVKAFYPAAWNKGKAAIHFWGDGVTGTTPAAMTKDGDWWTYTVTGVPTTSSLNVIFINGEGWDGDANQTVNIEGIKENTCYQITSGSGKATATAIDCESTPVVVEDVYTVVGSENLFGSHWAPSAEANDMEKQDDGSYKKVYSNVELTSSVEWKIAKNDDWWGDAPAGVNPSDNSNNVLTIAKSGIYNVTFVLSADLATATAEAELLEETNTVADCYISGNAALTGGAGWAGNEFKMEDYDSATKTYSYTLTGLVTDEAYELKVVLGGVWYTYANLASIPTGVTEGNDHSIAFKMAAAGDVVVTYNVEAGITLSGNFAAPVTYDYYIAGTENLTSFNWSANGLGMTKEGDVYKHTFNALAAGTYEFKITDGQWNTEEDQTHEWNYSNLGAAYEEVSEGTDGDGNPNGNIKFVTKEAKNITVIFDATAGKITFEGLTEKVIEYGVTFNVTVPEGTEACYICGEWEWETFKPMTKVDDTHYTLTIDNATKDHKYKYTFGEAWAYVEKNADGSDVQDRTWTENDVVAAWADPLATNIYLAGSMTGWAEGKIEFMKETPDATIATVAVELPVGDNTFKIMNGDTWLGNGGTVENSITGWTFKEGDGNCTLKATYAATYVFTWDLTKEDQQLSVTYPTVEELSYTGLDKYQNNMGLRSYTCLQKDENTAFFIYNFQQNEGSWDGEFIYGDEFNVTGNIGEVSATGTGSWKLVDGVETLSATLINDNKTTIYFVTATARVPQTYTLSCTNAHYVELAWGGTTYTGTTTDGDKLTIEIFNGVGAGTHEGAILNLNDYEVTAEATVTVTASGTTLTLTGAFVTEIGDTYNVTLTATPKPNTPLVVENANFAVADGTLTVTGAWNATTVTVTIANWDGDGTYSATLMTGTGEGDDDIYAVNEATISTTGSLTTLTGVFENWDSSKYDVTISGTFPTELATITLTTGNNNDVIAANIGKTVNVVIERSFTANNGYYTLCVPFDMPASVIGKAYQISSITEHAAQGIDVEFTEVANMLAGQPYLIKPNTIDNPIVAAVKINNSTPTAVTVAGEGISITMQGMFNSDGQTNGLYWVGNGGYLYNDNVSTNGLCAYFNISTPSGVAPRMRVVTGENETTGFDQIVAPAGQAVKVIENGQLIIIRDGVKYNVQGQKL